MTARSGSEREEPQPAARSGAAAPALLPSQIERDFRRSLHTILQEAGRIASDAESAGACSAEYARYVTAAAHHFAELIDDHGGSAAWTVQPVDLNAVLREAVRMVSADAAKAAVTLGLPEEGVHCIATGERRRILEIAINLLCNAIRHAPEESEVAIGLETLQSSVALSVKDEGRGIAAADHQRIFEKFERIDPQDGEGSGLGLYISRRLAREMGGDIAVESTPGAGACFTLTLPAGPAP